MIVLSGIVGGQSASALEGDGYYRDVPACTRKNGAETPSCSTSPYYRDDVIFGRTSSTSPDSVPATATASKAGFYTWLSGLSTDRTTHNGLARQFIIDTMIGGGVKNMSIATLKVKFDNPNISMRIINAVPTGKVSFYGVMKDSPYYKDMLFADSYTSSARDQLEFYNNKTGDIYYHLEIPCGNPIGGLPGLPSWYNLLPTASVSVPTATAGSNVTFLYKVNNTGTEKADNITWSVRQVILPASVSDVPAFFETTKQGTTCAAYITNGASSCAAVAGVSGTMDFPFGSRAVQGSGVNLSGQQTVTLSAAYPAGTWVCRVLVLSAYKPGSSEDRDSPVACVRITPSAGYVLSPSVSVAGAVVSAAPGDTVVFNYSVNKTGSLTPTSAWGVRQITVPPGVAINVDFLNNMHESWSCANYTGPLTATCVWLAPPLGESPKLFSSATTTLLSGGESVTLNPALAFGTRVCRVLVVDPYSSTSAVARDSAMKCITVAKAPALQVQNGDVRVGGAFSDGFACAVSRDLEADGNPYNITMTDYGSPTSRGSYGWFAATAAGRAANYGSFALPYGNVSSDKKKLLFGSTSTYFAYGEDNGLFYSTTLDAGSDTYCLPNMKRIYYAEIASATPLGSAVFTPAVSGAYKYELTGASSTLTINSSALGANKRILLYITTDPAVVSPKVVINGDITYSNSGYLTVADLPQFVLIADSDIDIHINPIVATLSGIYSTGGNIYTCADYDGTLPMSNATCNTALSVKGVLVAGKHLLPYRTFGYNAPIDLNPAEIFSLTPDTLLGDYERARSQPKLTTDSVNELPPRL